MRSKRPNSSTYSRNIGCFPPGTPHGCRVALDLDRKLLEGVRTRAAGRAILIVHFFPDPTRCDSGATPSGIALLKTWEKASRKA
jgi:hypothetical protein